MLERIKRGLYPEYEFSPHFLNVDGNRLHYIQEGLSSADPVVMLHGNPTWSFFYRKLILKLRNRYRAIAPDHIGMGLSDKPNESEYDYTLKRRVADLEILLDHLELDRNITLVIHDWGGMIGMALAIQDLKRIKRLVVLNTAAFHLPATKQFPWQLAVCRTPLFGSMLVRGLNLFCRDAVRLCIFNRPINPLVRDAYLRPYASWNDRVGVHRFIQDIPVDSRSSTYRLVSDVESKLHYFRNIPTLICWGMKDFIFDSHFLNTWTEFLPEAEVHRFDKAGHYLLEDAGEEIADLIVDFLNKNRLENN